MARKKPLTSIKVATVKAPGYYTDAITTGLYLQVTNSQTGVGRSWLYRYNSPITAKLRWLGLGSAADVSLADARKAAVEARRIVLRERRDPIEERRAAKTEALRAHASTMTFAQCVDAYIDQHGSTWKNDKQHRRQWRSTLERACAAFGNGSVADVATPAIVTLLTPIWAKTPETGSRLRGRIEKVLDWATAAGLREGPNPARWQGHLEHLLKRRPKAEHHSAMPWQELPAFMAMLRDRDNLSARALEFTILTAARTGEAIGARWDEIDLKAKVWTVPAERMKAKVEHKVPLSDRVVEILKGIERSSELIFPLSNMAMLQTLRRTAGNGYTTHGFRSAFRDWCGESTNYARDVIEFALAHKLPDKVEAAYRRETAVEKRRKLMQSWAAFCAKPATGENVVKLRKTG